MSNLDNDVDLTELLRERRVATETLLLHVFQQSPQDILSDVRGYLADVPRGISRFMEESLLNQVAIMRCLGELMPDGGKPKKACRAGMRKRIPPHDASAKGD